MGFFGNVGQAKAVKYVKYLEILNWMRNTKREDFGLIRSFNLSVMGPDINTSIDFDKICKVRDYNNGGMRDITEEEFNQDPSNPYPTGCPFRIEDDYTVTFTAGIYIHKIDKLPFKLSTKNSVCLSQVKDELFDSLPEELVNVWIHNAYRTNKTLSFKNLKKCRTFTITKLSQCTSLEGLETLQVNDSIAIKNCAKLVSTKGMPEIISKEFNNTINITGCTVLEDINIERGAIGAKIFIDKSCSSVNKVSALPDQTAIFICKTVSFSDIKKLPTKVSFVEVADFKGKGNAEIRQSSNDKETVISSLKEIIDNINAKRWVPFDDLWAVITFFGLCDYAVKGSQRMTSREPSKYIENGMIHSYDPEGEVVHYGYYGTGIQRASIKKGVCNYLNKIGVKYVFVNDDPKKKKEHEYIKIIM